MAKGRNVQLAANQAQRITDDMIDPPSPTAPNGRSANGRFGHGNTCARGNPHARRVARLRAELLRTVGPQDLREVIETLLSRAKAGEIAAAKEVLQRLLGPPVELDLLHRLEALEARLAEMLAREGAQG